MPVREFEVTRGKSLELILKGMALGPPTPNSARDSPIPGTIAHPIRVDCRFGGHSGELVWRSPKSWTRRERNSRI
jgi:hypothetical protein